MITWQYLAGVSQVICTASTPFNTCCTFCGALGSRRKEVAGITKGPITWRTSARAGILLRLHDEFQPGLTAHAAILFHWKQIIAHAQVHFSIQVTLLFSPGWNRKRRCKKICSRNRAEISARLTGLKFQPRLKTYNYFRLGLNCTIISLSDWQTVACSWDNNMLSNGSFSNHDSNRSENGTKQ